MELVMLLLFDMSDQEDKNHSMFFQFRFDKCQEDIEVYLSLLLGSNVQLGIQYTNLIYSVRRIQLGRLLAFGQDSHICGQRGNPCTLLSFHHLLGINQRYS